MLRLGAERIHLVTPGPPTDDKPGISLVGPADRNHPTGEVVLHVNDCHQVYAAPVERGGRLVGPPNELAWGGEIRCFLLDPDGHLIEFESDHRYRPTALGFCAHSAQGVDPGAYVGRRCVTERIRSGGNAGGAQVKCRRRGPRHWPPLRRTPGRG